MSTPPAGWIPPEFREPIYVDLSDEDVERIYGTCLRHDGSKMRPMTREEIRSEMKRCIGVRDTRTGKDSPNISGVLFVETDVNLGHQ